MRSLPVGGAEVWLLGEADFADPDPIAFTAAERGEFDRIVSATARRSRAGTRAALRGVLGQRLGVPPADVPLRRTPAGKLVLPDGAPPYFSVSHTSRRGAIALHSDPVGVDVERIDPPALRAVAGVFTHRSEATADAATLAMLWTGKEAVVKALGTGFVGMEPTEVVFTVNAGEPPRLWQLPGVDPARVEVCWFSPDPDHLVAVAVLS